MKKIIFASILMLGTIISSETKAQLQFENTFGFLVNDPSGISVGRGTVALNNLIPVADNKENKFNIGLYYTTEICCTFTSKYTKSVRQGLLRDLAGISFRFFDRFSVYAGAGFFRKGIFSDLAFKDIRKEVGASLQIPKHNLTLSSSYGVMKGLSLNVGYFVPVRPKSQESLKKGFPSLR